VIAALEAARVTIRTQQPEVRLRMVITGAGDNKTGHAATDMAGVHIRTLLEHPDSAIGNSAG
jgi:hypothetical protein